MDNGWFLLVIGFAGAAMFFAFIWMMTSGLRKMSAERSREKEAVRQAQLHQAREYLGENGPHPGSGE